MKETFKVINRTVIILSLVSFFTDAASEMLYPILPTYLREMGFSVMAIGILEGFAETLSAFLKGYSGSISDAIGRRNILIQVGYSISSIAKPLMGVASSVPALFSLRTLDRLGKGIRTAPRDALLSDNSPPEFRGRIFGFHRSMDTAGAVVGPLVTLLLLTLYSLSLRTLFLFSLIPGLLACLSSLQLPKEKSSSTHHARPRPGIRSMIEFWKISSPSYKKLVIGITTFGCVNSSDLFLFLKQSEAGSSLAGIVAAYCLYNLVYALFALPAGIFSDRFGFKGVFASGLLIFGVSYSIFALSSDLKTFFIGMSLYGVYTALTEGVSKAWISHYVPKHLEATGMGLLHTCLSLSLLVASPLTALLWSVLGVKFAFMNVAAAAIVVAVYFIIIPMEPLQRS